MMSSLGLDCASSCAAIRAQICRFREVEELHYCQGEDSSEPMPVIMAPAFDERPADDLGSLLLGALRDLVVNAKLARAEFLTIPVSLSLPSWAPAARIPEVRDRFLLDVSARGGYPTLARAKVTADDGAGMMAALAWAQGSIASGEIRGCVVAGVGSYFHSETLARLDAAGRLKSERNTDAFIPGECGVALLVESLDLVEKHGGTPLGVLHAIGQGHEPRGVASREISSGRGLGQAIEQALGAAQATESIEWAACDLNGESYRAREWGLAQVYLPRLLAKVRTVWHPADCLGDVGGASAGVLLATVARAFARGYHPSDRALVWTASEQGARSALVVDKP
jgi:3-oxoacyl-[acyl-carrier-protein] synthase-1